jgi:hypothetical protein
LNRRKADMFLSVFLDRRRTDITIAVVVLRKEGEQISPVQEPILER